MTRGMKFAAGSVIAFIMVTMSFPIIAGPPYLTDDPEPVEYHHQEAYIGAQITNTRDGSEGALPQAEFNYGAIPNVQLHVMVPIAFAHVAQGSSHAGLGDIELGAKYRFIQETDRYPMAAIFPAIIIATGNARQGLGNGATQLYLPLWVQKNWSEWQSNAGGGYWINRSPGSVNHWFCGWQLQKRISQRLSVGGEVFHSTEQASGEGASGGFNVGLSINLDEHNHVLLSVGRGLTNADATNRFSSYASFQRTW